MPDHQDIQRWHSCFGRGDNNAVRPSSRHEYFESIHSLVQEENPEMFSLHAGRRPALWVLDSIFQVVKGTQESKMGLEIRHIDQRRHFMFADGKGRGKLGWIFGVRRRRLLTSFGRCRRRGWETDTAKRRHGVGLDPATSALATVFTWWPREGDPVLRKLKGRPN